MNVYRRSSQLWSQDTTTDLKTIGSHVHHIPRDNDIGGGVKEVESICMRNGRNRRDGQMRSFMKCQPTLSSFKI